MSAMRTGARFRHNQVAIIARFDRIRLCVAICRGSRYDRRRPQRRHTCDYRRLSTTAGHYLGGLCCPCRVRRVRHDVVEPRGKDTLAVVLSNAQCAGTGGVDRAYCTETPSENHVSLARRRTAHLRSALLPFQAVLAFEYE